jgi:hypothetical protein
MSARHFMLAALLIALTSAASAQDPVEVVLYLEDATVVTGRLASVDHRAIVVRSADGNERSFALDSVRTTALIAPVRRGLGSLAVMGAMYAGATIGSFNNEPGGGAFIPGDGGETYVGWGIGGLVGGIVGMLAEGDRANLRTEYDVRDSAARARLVAAGRAALTPRADWQITFHGGVVPTTARDGQEPIIYAAGIRNYPDEEFSPGMFRANLAATTLLRRVDVTRSQLEYLDLAASVISLNQPGIDVTSFDGSSSSRTIREGYVGTAVVAGGRVRLGLGSRALPFLRAGVSVGVASSSVERDFVDYASRFSLAAHASVELVVPIGDYLIVGGSADYTAVPPLDVPADARRRIASSRVDLSAPTYGFLVGVRL